MFDRKSLAILIAAIDGVNPNLETCEDGAIRLHTDRGTSDLDLTISEKLDKYQPHLALRDVAFTARLLVGITAQVVAGEDYEVDTAAVAERCRKVLFLLNTAPEGLY